MLYHIPFPTANALTVNSETSQHLGCQSDNFSMLLSAQLPDSTIDCRFIWI